MPSKAAQKGRPTASGLGGQRFPHLGGDVPPNPELVEVGLDQSVDSQEPDHRQRLNTVARAKTNDMSADAGGIDHGSPEAPLSFGSLISFL